jgi:hypothetical protein
MRRTLVLGLLLILGGYQSVAAQGIPGVGNVPGFKTLSVPRRDIPIGAQWLPGIGPAGNGTAAEALTVRRGLSTSALTSTQRRQIATSLATYFGLTASVSKEVEILYNELSVITAPDITQSQIKSGQSVLYEGIKASKFQLKYKSSLDNAVRAALTAKGIPVESNAGAAGGESVAAVGEDLFVAYRVVKFESQGVKRQSKRVSYEGQTYRTKLGRYEIDIDFDDVPACYCQRQTPERWSSCAKTAVSEIQVRSFEMSSGPSGGIYETTLQYLPHEHQDRPFKLATSEDGGNITTDYLRVMVRYSPVGGMKEAGLCMVEIDEPYSRFELITSKFKLRHVASPEAPGW